ncbi:MAG: tyrosine-protein phosphatase [Bacteroides sp.]|nr:tyrosine-protein phosphatase [Bacteroides sp.]
MCKDLFSLLSVILFFSSCSGEAPAISVVCEENSVGNCIIKWETTPTIEGKVKVYASTNPDQIKESNPVAMSHISDQKMVIITSDPTQRYYYKLVFNNKYRVVVGSRNINIPGIQNVRDMGGYPADRGKMVRWGKIYRSAEFDKLPLASYKELRNIGIRTIIDLRDASEIPDAQGELKERGFNVVHLPIGIFNTHAVIEDLRKGVIRNDSVNRLVLRLHREMATYYRDEYKQMFNLLLEPHNYPVLIHCTSGKARTAIASALILSAIGVNDDIILQDYRNSNDYFDIPSFSRFAYKLPSYSQEAITTLFSARESFLNAAKEQIRKNYGNMDTYLSRGIGLSKEDIDTLRDILLK